MKIDWKISFILIAAIIIASVGVLFIFINPSPSERFTEFYILGPEGKAGNYPTDLTLGENGTLNIGIVNHEGKNTSYQLVVHLNNKTLKNEAFNLKDDENKTISFTFQSNQTGNDQKLEFILYKLPDVNKPYRELELLIDVS